MLIKKKCLLSGDDWMAKADAERFAVPLDFFEKITIQQLKNWWQGKDSTDLAALPISKVKHYGTDNAIFRIGEEYTIRLPRVDYAAQQIKKEVRWLPHLSNHLPLTIPTPVRAGKPSERLPYPWYIYKWIDGVDAYNEPPSDLNQVAKNLAEFIKVLWQIDTNDANGHADRNKEVRHLAYKIKKYARQLTP